jgi:hypothetical protein
MTVDEDPADDHFKDFEPQEKTIVVSSSFYNQQYRPTSKHRNKLVD